MLTKEQIASKLAHQEPEDRERMRKVIKLTDHVLHQAKTNPQGGELTDEQNDVLSAWFQGEFAADPSGGAEGGMVRLPLRGAPVVATMTRFAPPAFKTTLENLDATSGNPRPGVRIVKPAKRQPPDVMIDGPRHVDAPTPAKVKSPVATLMNFGRT